MTTKKEMDKEISKILDGVEKLSNEANITVNMHLNTDGISGDNEMEYSEYVTILRELKIIRGKLKSLIRLH